MKRLTLLTNPDLCNLHCPLCFLNQRRCGGHAFGLGEMKFETARAAIEKYAAERDASGNRVLREVIPSTMGEPLLYSHFDELLDLCRELKIPLNLTTNGTFPGKWGSGAAMETLLRSCSDIKVSYLASEQFGGWKSNVEKLLNLRNAMRVENASQVGMAANIATVSLQVTLHRKNLQNALELVSWASAVGVDRIKWNPVVFLKSALHVLREMYEPDGFLLEKLRKTLRTEKFCSSKIKHEGSLFFEKRADLCAVGGKCESCPFADEVWVWPDGHEDHCPNPERRYGAVLLPKS